jgi:undecaprenyl-diphosphatase
MDAEITRWINSFAGASPAFDQVMIFVTSAGVPLIVGLVVLQWWSRADRRHVRHAAICAGLSFLLGLAINQLILLGVHRLRPYDMNVTQLLITPSADWSFPSDHATASMAVALAFLLQGLRGRSWALFGLAFLVCLSRIFVGTHFVTDVLGGAATGLVAAITVRLLYRENTRIDRLLTGIF